MTTNIMIVGLGYHARRIYIPSLLKLQKKYDISISTIVDIEKEEKKISNYLLEKNVSCDTYFIREKELSIKKLHKNVKNKLKELINEHLIDGVIIATEPLSHRMYAEFFLDNDISILMDKPISSRKNVSNNNNQAKKLVDDYKILNKKYEKAKKRGNILFSMMAQRRYHNAYLKIKEKIREVTQLTNCPITSIQSFHCDGMWRTPNEIIDFEYHPYIQGYGKCSHSGYHFFDLLSYLLEDGVTKDKYYDSMEVSSQFVKPLDFIHQITDKDYRNLFGAEYDNYNVYTDKQKKKLMKDFGEVDAYNRFVFKQKGNILTTATINLLHNGFSQRDWLSSDGRDLYKGNGRVRHESHIIEQGAFQAIHFHSYQAKEVNPDKKDDLYKVGGEHHLDIYIFRNNILGGKCVEKISVNDLDLGILEGKSRGHQEDARLKSVEELILFIQGKIYKRDVKSDFSKHKISALITSAVHQSAIQHKIKKYKIGGLIGRT